MKYVSRSACELRGALGGVIKEVELLSSLEHPFLVNLWFSFQGESEHTLQKLLLSIKKYFILSNILSQVLRKGQLKFRIRFIVFHVDFFKVLLLFLL